MGIFDRFRRTNAVQINDVSQTERYRYHNHFYTNYIPEFHKGDKPLGWLMYASILNVLWKGISNITFENSGKNIFLVDSIIKFIDANASLMVNQYIEYGFICVFYDKDKNFRLPSFDPLDPSKSEIKFNDNGQIVNKYAVVIYSPQYQKDRRSLLSYGLPLITEINHIAGSDSFLTETLGCLGLLTGEEISKNAEQRKAFLKSLRTKYGIGEDKYQFILSDEDLKYQKIDPPVKDLELITKAKDFYKMLANLFGVPLPLLLDDQSTYNNVREARIFLYDNTIRYYAEILLKVGQNLITASGEFIPQNALTYHFTNIPEMETSISAACAERTALLEYLLKLKDAGMDVEKELIDLTNNSKGLLHKV